MKLNNFNMTHVRCHRTIHTHFTLIRYSLAVFRVILHRTHAHCPWPCIETEQNETIFMECSAAEGVECNFRVRLKFQNIILFILQTMAKHTRMPFGVGQMP